MESINRKIVDELSSRAGTETQIVENRHVDMGWGDGRREGGLNWEIRFDINTLPCVKYIASGKLLISAQLKELSSVLCDDLDGCNVQVGWEGRPRGRGYMYSQRVGHRIAHG